MLPPFPLQMPWASPGPELPPCVSHTPSTSAWLLIILSGEAAAPKAPKLPFSKLRSLPLYSLISAVWMFSNSQLTWPCLCCFSPLWFRLALLSPASHKFGVTPPEPRPEPSALPSENSSLVISRPLEALRHLRPQHLAQLWVTSVLSAGFPHLQVPSIGPHLHISRPNNPSPCLNQLPLLASSIGRAAICDSSFPQAPHPFLPSPFSSSFLFLKPSPQPRFTASHM